MLVEWLCARNGFVHTSLTLAEDDGWAGRWLVTIVQVCATQCSHALFYADSVACAGALRVRGLILIAHGSNCQVVYIPCDGCSACARVGTKDQTRV